MAAKQRSSADDEGGCASCAQNKIMVEVFHTLKVVTAPSTIPRPPLIIADINERRSERPVTSTVNTLQLSLKVSMNSTQHCWGSLV